MRRPWPPEDEEILFRYYSRLGAVGLHRRLLAHHSVRAIYNKANRMGLIFGAVDPRRYVRCCDLDRELGLKPGATARKAQGDGIAELVQRGLFYALCVPPEWADEYREEVTRRAEADELAPYWYDTPKTARILGVSIYMLRDWAMGRDGAARAEDFRRTVELRVCSGRLQGRFIYNPYHVEALARRWRREEADGQEAQDPQEEP